MLDSTVFVVDDDRRARDSVCALVISMGLSATGYDSAESFLADFDPHRAGCLVTDLRMNGMSGEELQAQLQHLDALLPVILITAFPRTDLTVRVMQNGAISVLEKPYNDDDLWSAIRQALQQDQDRREQERETAGIRRRIDRLSDREMHVMNAMAAGHPNKVIASQLEISVRTVENRRQAVFRKMEANSVAELVRLLLRAEHENGDVLKRRG